jgi:hypothetical protein
LLEHLRSEFDSADSVDLLCAFIKLSGFEKFRSEIERGNWYASLDDGTRVTIAG